MFVADHLSRAFLEDTGPEDEEFQVFALELEALNPFDTIKRSVKDCPSFKRPQNKTLSCRPSKLPY